MSYRKAKSAPKIFISDRKVIREKVLATMKRISDAVGSSLGPSGLISMIESDFEGIPNKLTKDGVTIFKSLGSHDAYEHLIMETARDVAQKTATEAGDGTTTATLLAYSIIKNLFEFCEKNPKYSPQKAARHISRVTKDLLVPYIESRAIKITEDNKELLKMVAKISANGDEEMASAVIDAFEQIGYGDSSHVTIRELSGNGGYKVERIDGFPIAMGMEELGKIHTAFVNDRGGQRCFLEKPLFLLFDGMVNDLVSFLPLMESLGKKYVEEGDSDFKNLVIFAHGYSDNVLTQLAFNFSNPLTLNVLPMMTPMAQFLNSQTHFMYDLAAFTGSKVFGLKDQINNATLNDLGAGMDSFEAYRFRSTVVGNSDPLNIEVRSEELKTQLQNSEGVAEKILLEERIGKITNGIAKLTIYGGSGGELKEKHDRVEDAVLATRSAITHGALPGGCRIAVDMAVLIQQSLKDGDPAKEVLLGSLLSLPYKLLDNAGYTREEQGEILEKLVTNPDLVYDVENQTFGNAQELGLFDSSMAVIESLRNAVSLASVLGTMGGLIAHPRDSVFERQEAAEDTNFQRNIENAENIKNEADARW